MTPSSPDNANTCCPQLTIRLDAMAFKPDKKLRHALNRWKRFILDGEQPGTPNDKDMKTDPKEEPVGGIDRPNRKQKQFQGNFDFLTELHSTESRRAGSSASHIFQVSDVHHIPETLELTLKETTARTRKSSSNTGDFRAVRQVSAVDSW